LVNPEDQSKPVHEPQPQAVNVFTKPPAPVIVYTASNLDVYNAVIFEEDGELIPPDEETLSRRRLSSSVPYGLNMIIVNNTGFNQDGLHHNQIHLQQPPDNSHYSTLLESAV
jgi:hypothetical protein